MSRGADSPTAHARLPPEIGDAVSDVVTVFARLVPRARIARVAAVAACALLPACASLAPADDAASTSPPLPLLSPPSLGRSEEHTSELQSLMRPSYAASHLQI